MHKNISDWNLQRLIQKNLMACKINSKILNSSVLRSFASVPVTISEKQK